MLKYYSLASGSKGNSTLIQNDEDMIMIDCGGTKTHLLLQLKKINIQMKDIDALLITHSHTDHIAQLNSFKNHQIYSLADLKYPFQKIECFKSFEIGSFKITAIPLSHDCANTVGYIVETKNEKLVYITDTGYVQEKYYSLISNADFILLEFNHDLKMLMETTRPMYLKQRIQGDNGHLCNEDAAIILANIVGPRTKEIGLAHLSQEANLSELAYHSAKSALTRLPYKNYRIQILKQFELVTSEKDT
ncbi:MAG: MBL fold metallo-hydrolase [Erysipelotrichaceae bacterium]